MRVGLRRLARPRSLFATATIMSSVVVLTNAEPETNVTPDTNSANEEEPQNALTQKFTDKEWVALKEFRVRRCTTPPHPSLTHCCLLSQPHLPDILEKAYDGKEGARTTPIVIWGVELDPNGKKDARASVVLMKWLRAR
jgi:hypothetical protein